MIRTITAKDFAKKPIPEGHKVYIWAETGEGNLYEVIGVSSDCWVRCKFCSFCCCWDSELIVATPEDAAIISSNRAKVLAYRRNMWTTVKDWWKQETPFAAQYERLLPL